MKTKLLYFLLFAFSACLVNAEILFYDGINTGSDGYNIAADAQKDAKSVTPSTPIGFSSTKWANGNASVIYVFGENYGLQFPEIFGTQIVAEGGSIGYKRAGSNTEYRSQWKYFDSSVFEGRTGSVYFRFLFNIDATALANLKSRNTSSGVALLNHNGTPSFSSHFGNDKVTSGIIFSIRKGEDTEPNVAIGYRDINETSNSYENLFRVEAGVTYMAVAKIDINAGTDNKEKVSFAVVPVDDYERNVEWLTLANGTEEIEIEFISEETSPNTLFIGSAYTTNDGYILFDEMGMSTELTELVVVLGDDFPSLKSASFAYDNEAQEATITFENEQKAAAALAIIEDSAGNCITNVLGEVADYSTANLAVTFPAENTTYKITPALRISENYSFADPFYFYNGVLNIEVTQNGSETDMSSSIGTISRAAADAYPITVNLVIEDGTAVAGVNYDVPESLEVTIPANAQSATFEFPTVYDGETSSDTSFSVGFTTEDAIASSSTVTFTVANYVILADKNYWIAGEGSDCLASNPNNWSYGRVPTATDHVGLTAVSSMPLTNDVITTVASWTQTAEYNSTVTFMTVYPEKGSFNALTVTGDVTLEGGEWTHPVSFTAEGNITNEEIISLETYRLKVIVEGNLVVGENAKISVDGKGHCPASNVAAFLSRHGGTASAAAESYGDPKYPIHVGAGEVSKAYQSGAIANGGGAIYLDVMGNVTINGEVSARGGVSTRSSGAGGSILIEAGNVSGSGLIAANAVGVTGYSYRNEVGGAGGRIAVISSATISEDLDLDAGTEHRTSEPTAYIRGSAGTVYLKDFDSVHGTLVVDDDYATSTKREGGTKLNNDSDWTFDSILLGGAGRLVVVTNTALTLANGYESISSLDNATAATILEYCNGGSIVTPDEPQTIDGINVYVANDDATLVIENSLMLTNGAALGRVNYSTKIGSNVDPMDVHTSAKITVNGDLTISADSKVSVYGSGVLQDSHNFYSGYSQSCHGSIYAGSFTNKYAYGSILNPRTPGFSQSNSYYQPGGGALELVVNGILTVDGEIASKGAISSNNGVRGAPGSVDVRCESLAGTGLIGAVPSGNHQMAGGRVAVRLTGEEATFDNFEGTISARSINNEKCTSGTIYLQDGTQLEGHGTIIIDGESSTSSARTAIPASAQTPIPANGAYADEAIALKNCNLDVYCYSPVVISCDLKLNDMTVDSTSTVELYGNTLTVRSLSVGGVPIPSGTYNVDAEVLGSTFTDVSEAGGGQVVVLGSATMIIIR